MVQVLYCVHKSPTHPSRSTRSRMNTNRMSTHSLLPQLAFTVLFFLLSHPIPTVGRPSKDTEFIRTSCGTTLYPDLCYTSLSRFASAVEDNPTRLARVAIGVSLARARRMAAYVSNIYRQAEYGADRRAASALHDCFSNFGDAVDEIRGSLKQMRQLSSTANSRGGSSSFLFQMSNVQTWMSAALTDEDTCTDGFDDVEDGPLKTDVSNRVENVKKVTSNALALVNSVAEKGAP